MAARDEVEAVFLKYVERGKANDWSAWADQFTEDARYVEHASMASQRILTLGEVRDETVPYFAMLLVHRRGDAWK